MGNKSQKQTNQMLANQTAKQNAAGDTFGGRSEAEYGWKTSARQDLWDQYNARMGEAPELTGGSAGTADWYGPAADFYRGMMDNGGFSEGDKSNYRSWTTAPISGFYTGLKDQMTRKNAATGGYAGYNSQTAKLARDAAMAGAHTAQESESGLLDMINKNKFQGAGGLESSFHKGSPGSAGSRGGVGSQDYYLNKMEGLMEGTTDIPYGQMQMQGYGQGTNAVNARVDETPAWQKALTGIVPAAVNAGIGAFTGGKKSNPGGGGTGWGAYG